MPGLRIEEAASLAGVSLTWYTALERGSGVRVSANMLERIGDALRLTSEEREHLASLARPEPRSAAKPSADAWLQKIVDGFCAGPAYISDRLWNVRVFNAIADEVYGFSSSPEPNLLVRMLLEPQLRDLHEHWERIARQMVEIVHLAYGRKPEDLAAVELVARLRGASPDFSLWWDGYGLRRFVPTEVSLHHPTLGRLRLTFTGFVPYAMPSAHDWAVVVLQPAADAQTLARVATATGGLRT